MSVELPKDAEGREIPLDTRVLYDEDGNAKEVQRYTYSVRQTIPRRKWDAVMLDNTCRYVSNLYITSPTTPDTWEKLEEDLNRAAKRDDVTSQCRYFNTTNRCVNCPIHNDFGGCAHKDERAFGDILNRIRKLRGEDDA